MSKAIQSIDTAISSAKVLRHSAGKRAGQDESGGFSSLLSAGRAEHTEHAEARAVPEGGKNLPDERSQTRAGDGTKQDSETPAASRDVVQTTDRLPSDAAAGGLPPANAPEQPEELSSAVAAGMAGQADPAAEITIPDGPVAPADEIPGLEAGSDEALVHAGDADTTQAVAVSSGPVSQIVAGEQPDVMRNRTPPDPVGPAVRETVMQMLASGSAQGGGDALAGGNSEQPASFEQPVSARNAATGVVSFTDTLLETGSTTPSARVAVPVGQPGWGRAVGEQVVWFVSQNIQSASLKLNPQHLGPLELQLHMDGDKASIAFTSQHAAVRDALESSLSRLRDMLSEQGVNLINVNVSQHDAGSRREQASNGNRAGASTRTAGVEELHPLTGGMPGAATARGLVDYYV